MRSQKGFIQIPILIAIIAGFLLLGGGYVGVKQYQSYKALKDTNEQLMRETTEQKDLEVEKLRQELEALKNQRPQVITQIIKQESTSSNIDSKTKEVESLSLMRAQIQSQTPNITEIINNWRFFTAKLECSNSQGDIVWGSGFFTKDPDGNFKVLTNKHVVENLTTCSIKSPGDPNNVYRSSIIYRGSGDFATLFLGNSNDYLKNLIAGEAYYGICKENQKPVLGDEIAILGYPGAGSQTDVTVTRGIISGFEGSYFITDAKINPGNSGGVAINIRYNCYFGIPTYVNTTGFEVLGRILDIWKAVGQF